MRHRVAGRKLGRKTNHRVAMWRNMAIALFTHGQITTTLPKAKSLKPFVEKIITTAKKNDIAARRRITRMLGRDQVVVDFDVKQLDPDDLQVKQREGYRINKYGEILDGPKIVKKIVEDIAPRYADRNGGYTRIIKLAKYRIGDGSDLCVIQLVGTEQAGPQVKGQFSRRRQKADKRTAFAARLRKGEGAPEDIVAAGEAQAEASIATAVSEAESPQTDPAAAEETSPSEADVTPETEAPDESAQDEAGDEQKKD